MVVGGNTSYMDIYLEMGCIRTSDPNMALSILPRSRAILQGWECGGVVRVGLASA